MKKTIMITCTLLAALLFASFGVFSAFADTTQTFTLAGSSNQFQFVLPEGATFNGSVSTTGLIRVWVNGPSQIAILNLGLIDKTTTFNFVAQQNGTYLINFENDLSSSIQVTFSYITNPSVQGISTSGSSSTSQEISLTYTLITVVAAVAGSVVIILLLRRQKKLQTATQRNNPSSNP